MLFVKSHVACCVCWYIAQTNYKYLYMLDRNKKVDLRKGELTVNMIKNPLIFRLWIITKHKRGYSYSIFLMFAVQTNQIRAFVVPEQHLPVKYKSTNDHRGNEPKCATQFITWHWLSSVTRYLRLLLLHCWSLAKRTHESAKWCVEVAVREVMLAWE